MSRFSIALIRLATLALLGSAGTAAYAQKTIDQNKALAGNVTPGDAPGFPITLSVPGHYKLMSNLNVPAGTRGIHITAPNVTLDLNGFTLAGPVSCAYNLNSEQVTCSHAYNPAADGVVIQEGASGARIRGGTVRGFAGDGITGQANGPLLTEMRATENVRLGFYLGIDSDGQARQSVAEVNGSSGFQGGQLIVGSVSRRNGGYGFRGNVLVVHDSVAYRNVGKGVYVQGLKGTYLLNNKQGNVEYSVSMGGNLNGSTPF